MLKSSAFLIGVLFFSATAHSTEPTYQPAIDECMKFLDWDYCEDVTGRLNGDYNRPDLALMIAEKTCELSFERCSQVYFSAGKISKKAKEDAFTRMKTRCDKEPGYCEPLSVIYRDRNEPKLALASAKKYFDKYKKGSYLWIAYKNRTDLKAVFEGSLADCRSNNQACIEYLRSMADHPEHGELVSIAEGACKKSNGTILYFGATTCTVVGTYYYKQKNFAKAQDLWSYECKTNQTACLLIFGAENLSEESKAMALKNFCASTHEFASGSTPDLRKRLCNGDENSGQLPMLAADKGRSLLYDFLADQR